jgi:protein TonB
VNTRIFFHLKTTPEMKYLFFLTALMICVNGTMMGQEPPASLVPPPEQKKEVFAVVEKMPLFPGCEELDKSQDEKQWCAQNKLLEYVYSSIVYPEGARKDSIEGKVVVQFIVEKDGTLTDIQAIRGEHEELNAEAIRVVESMNHMEKKWTPGYQRGEAVAVKFVLPMSFKLSK